VHTKRILKIVGFIFIVLRVTPLLGQIQEIDKEKLQLGLRQELGENALLFEKNDGQFAEKFHYRYSSSNACVDFYEDKILFGLREATTEFDPRQIDNPVQFDYVTWGIKLVGANSLSIIPDGLDESSPVNFFAKNGKNIKQRRTSRLRYENVYPHIDLVFYTTSKGELKYDFILKKGALLSDIRLKYENVSKLSVSEDKELVYHTKWGEIREAKPFSYRQKNGKQVSISYSVTGETVQFKSSFNRVEETIVLDPIYVDWSTYFYGTGNNGFTWAYTSVYDLDVDDAGFVYATGITNDRFPGLANSYDTTTNGFYDAFICKMAPNGDSIVWFSYLGGSSYEYCFTLAVNDNQEPVVSGFTWSNDFPITPGAYDTTPNITNGWTNYYAGFVSKFNKDGDSLIFSTYLGGDGSDLIHSLILDDSNNIYIAGETRSTDFPTTSGCYQSKYGGNSTGGSWWTGGDGFITKMRPDGKSVEFSTYLGSYAADAIYEIALSSKKEIFVVGKTASTNFPVTPGARIFNYSVVGPNDGFVCRFSADGKRMLYGKLMGGSGEDWFEGIYVNQNDEAYIAGITRSSDFYTTTNAYQRNNKGGADIVVVKLPSGGQNVYYSTYLGGSGDELYYSGFIYNSNVRIAANVREEAIICGISRSNDFPVTTDALQDKNPSSNGAGTWWNSSATIAKLDHTGRNLLYGTYYGGSGYEVPGANRLKRTSCYTNILYGGFTSSSDYPTTKGVFREDKSSASSGFFWTGFISRFRDTLYTDLIELSFQDTILECDNVFELFNSKNIGADILWSNGSTNQYQTIEEPGMVWVQATYGCDTVRDTVHIELEYSPVMPVLPNDSVYCDNFPSITLDAKNDTIDASYLWHNGDTVQTQNINTAGKYWVQISTPNCGTETDTVTYKLRQTPEIEIFTDSLFCDSVNVLLTVGMLGNDESYVWSTLDSVASAMISDTGTYWVKIDNMCGEDSASFSTRMLYTPQLSLPADSQFCDAVQLTIPIGREENEEVYLASEINTQTGLFVQDSISFNSPGVYEVNISNGCGSISDTIALNLIQTPTSQFYVDSVFCDVVSYPVQIGTPNNDETYLWNDGITVNTRIISDSGVYIGEISNKCGTATDSFILAILKSPRVQLPEDSVFCNDINWVVDASFDDEVDYVWQDGSTLPIYTISEVGTYTVSLTNKCGTASDDVEVGILYAPTVDLGEDLVFCGGLQPVNLEVGRENNQELVLWSTGDETPNVSLFNAGNYWVTLTNKCGLASDSLEIRLIDNPIVDLGPDTTLCGDFSVILDAGNEGMNYLWFPYGEQTRTIEATEQITYRVEVTNEFGCLGSDEFTIDGGCKSFVHVPNAFSPNNDGLNDFFRPTLINYQDFWMKIYNRWGELVYSTEDEIRGWDGTLGGEALPEGVYMYQIGFISTESMRNENLSGQVHLLR
jgi:gliding motility-associated-like protein